MKIVITINLTYSELYFLCRRLDECDNRFDDNKYMQSLKTKLGDALEESMQQMEMQFKAEYTSEWVGQKEDIK